MYFYKVDSTNLILAFAGIIISILETLYPKRAQRVEKFIDALEERLFELGETHQKIWYQIMFSISIATGLIIGVGSFFDPHQFGTISWIIFWITQVPTWTVIGIILLAEFIELLNRLSPRDNAFNMLGLIIGAIGCVLEIIQRIV